LTLKDRHKEEEERKEITKNSSTRKTTKNGGDKATHTHTERVDERGCFLFVDTWNGL
jgi:hypothetical protein